MEDVPGIKDGKRLLVSGDNVMQGYMFADNPDVLVPPKDGWHDTGDIVDIDKDGFIFIKGRAKRFAKIGGEMISLTAVEQVLSKLYPDAVQGIVSVPDEKKGERLVLITTKPDVDLSEVRAYIKSRDSSLFAYFNLNGFASRRFFDNRQSVPYRGYRSER